MQKKLHLSLNPETVEWIKEAYGEGVKISWLVEELLSGLKAVINERKNNPIEQIRSAALITAEKTEVDLR